MLTLLNVHASSATRSQVPSLFSLRFPRLPGDVFIANEEEDVGEKGRKGRKGLKGGVVRRRKGRDVEGRRKERAIHRVCACRDGGFQGSLAAISLSHCRT